MPAPFRQFHPRRWTCCGLLGMCVCASLISAWLREGERKGSDIFTLFLRYLSRKLLLKDSKKHGQLTRSSHCPFVGFLSVRGSATREEGPPLAGDRALDRNHKSKSQELFNRLPFS